METWDFANNSITIELMRVLFDVLEATTKQKSQQNQQQFITHLYRGVMNDYLEVHCRDSIVGLQCGCIGFVVVFLLLFFQCKSCGNTNLRADDFLDLALPVRGVNTLEESLASYLMPEVRTNRHACCKQRTATFLKKKIVNRFWACYLANGF